MVHSARARPKPPASDPASTNRPLTDSVDSPVEAIALGEEHGMVDSR